ncbi:MAG: T9SS type A sorting domain-containing protein [Bacteroidia bacterium]|nr:T9SS type A sorting domain-containing protein [Bacteroidia bacterium]
MLKTRWVCLLLFLAFYTKSFSQVQLQNVDSVKNYLSGTWEWYKSCGGIAGFCYTPASPGYTTQALKFSKVPGSADSIDYSSYQAGNLVASGRARITYSTSGSAGIWNVESVQFLAVSSIKYKLSVLIAKPDSVWLRESCSDCFTRQYKRSANQSLGINKNFENALRVEVYPNPVINKLQFNLPTDLTIKSLVIYNFMGQKSSQNLNPNAPVNLAPFSPGVYFIEIETNKGTVLKKIIKS